MPARQFNEVSDEGEVVVFVGGEQAADIFGTVVGDPGKFTVVIIGKAGGNQDPFPGGHIGQGRLVVGAVEHTDGAGAYDPVLDRFQL